MLFWIEGDSARANVDMQDAQLKSAISNIVSSVRAGLHILGGERPYLQALADVEFLSEEIRSTISWSEQQLSQEGAFLDAIPKLRTSALVNNVSQVGDDWCVPLWFLAEARRCERTKILVENLTDFSVYRAFALRLLQSRVPALTLSLQPLNGGGDTTADVLFHESNAGIGRLLCIVDSDRKVASERPKQTARRCIDIYASIQDCWMYELVVLDCRELENLIPPVMRGMACNNLPVESRQRVGELVNLPDSIISHVCLKKGDRLCRFYCNGVIEPAEITGTIGCTHCGLVGMGCASTPGLGERFLRRVADGLESGLVRICEESIWSAELHKVASKVLAIGLSRPISRVA